MPEQTIPLPEAARRLGIHYQTAWAWAIAALTGGPSRFRPEGVRRGVSRRIYVLEGELKRLESETIDDLLR